jgi:hypothetical protein
MPWHATSSAGRAKDIAGIKVGSVFLDGERIMRRQPDQIGEQRAVLGHFDNATAERRMRRHDQGARHPGTPLDPPASAEGATSRTGRAEAWHAHRSSPASGGDGDPQVGSSRS